MGRMLSAKTLAQPVAARHSPMRVAEPEGVAATTPKISAPLPDRLVEDHFQNPLRRIAFYSGLGMLFLRMGVIPEVMMYLTGTSFYLLYLFGPPAIIGGILTGAVQRTFRYRAAWCWAGFFAWMLLATPFSSWTGGSVDRVVSYGRVNFALLFVAGGLAMNWKEIRTIFYTIALAAVTNLLTAHIFAKADMGGRFSMEASGTIGNANDLAAHLILVMPFLLFVILDPRCAKLIRILLLATVPYALWVILGTGSRGALVSLLMMFLFAIWRASPSQRAAAMAIGVVMAVVIPLLLPETVVSRLGSLFGQEHIEAEESGASRSYLFRQSLIFTVQNPIFGVGPDQFSNFEGKMRLSEGRYGNWHVTHNSWTQVSSECGIPALIFFALAISSALFMVNRVYREARQRGFVEIANACFCYLLGMVGYLTAITFLSSAYTFYLPTMIGLSCSISFLATKHMQTMNTGAAQTVR